MENTPYHEVWADISIHFLNATVHLSLTNIPTNSDTTITVVKPEPGLISKYHIRSVLMVPFPVPACPYVASAAMIMSQSGYLAGVIPSYYQTSMEPLGRNTMSNSLNQLNRSSRRWDKLVFPQNSYNDTAFSWCGHPQLMSMRPFDSSSGLLDTMEDFGDATLWHSCVPRYRPLRHPTTRQRDNEFKNSKWVISWDDCHQVLKLQSMHNDSTQLCIWYNCNILSLGGVSKTLTSS